MKEVRVVTFETAAEVVRAMSNDAMCEGREEERVGVNHSLMLHVGKRPHFLCSLDADEQTVRYEVSGGVGIEDLIIAVFKHNGQTPVGVELEPRDVKTEGS